MAQFLMNDFNKSNFYKDINAKVMYHSGEVKDVKTFYHPIMISDPSFPVGEWKPLMNKEEKGIAKSDLKAISIDGKLWLPRPTPLGDRWVAMKYQGAIERYIYPTNTDGKTRIIEEMINRDLISDRTPKDIKIITALATRKLGGEPISENQMLNFAKEMGKMTSDNTELSSKITSKTKGYKFGSINSIISEYNDWYDQQHPDEVKRITSKDWGESAAPTGVTLKQGLAKFKNSKADAKAKYEAKKASRPSTAPASIAEAKPNVPVKKESFTMKINRIKSDGNKVGVLFANPYVYIKPPVGSTSGSGGMSLGMSSPAKGNGHPKDTVVAYSELKALGQSFVEKMNTAFDTDVFELIENTDQVPLRKSFGSFLIDDWWATKYKVLMTYSVDTYYDISKSSGKYSGDFRATSHLTAMEFMLKKGKPSQKVVVGMAAMGNYHKSLKESEDDSIKTIADIQDQMDGGATGSEIYETLLSERVASLDKLIAKKKK